MEVDITDKGRDYLDRMWEGNLPESATDGLSIYDFDLLAHLKREGSVDMEADLEYMKRKVGPVTSNSFRQSFRRLFEAGYIEEV